MLQLDSAFIDDDALLGYHPRKEALEILGHALHCSELALNRLANRLDVVLAGHLSNHLVGDFIDFVLFSGEGPV